MKQLRLEMTPTRSRRLNEILGLGLLTIAVLLLLALVSYNPLDPSWNTTGGNALRPVHNWAGRVGAIVSDLLLQGLGIAALVFPIALARLAVCWMRSRPQGSPAAKTIGLLLWIASAPAALALLPIHLLWRGALPIEGVEGRLLADAAIPLLNYPGACVLLALAVVLSVYLSTTFTFNTAQDWAGQRLGLVYRVRERYVAWRHGRSDLKTARAANRLESRREREAIAAERAAERAASGSLVGSLFAKWGFWRRRTRPSAEPETQLEPASRTVWAQMPRTDVDAGPEPEFAPLPGHLKAQAEAHLLAEDRLHAEPAQENFADWTQPATQGNGEQPFAWTRGRHDQLLRAKLFPSPLPPAALSR